MIARTTLISYALSFVSFLLDTIVGKDIQRIILFGSVARGDFTKDSDIDLFVEVEEKQEQEIQKQLVLFRQSQFEKMWVLKGVTNDISLKVGKLQQWKLKRQVISSGMLLYGKYDELPENTTYCLLVQTDVSKNSVSKQMRVWRALYGYVQKIGAKRYEQQGLVQKAGGKKLGKGVFIIPFIHRSEIIQLLNKNNISHKVYELWSDAF
ncbi:MAG: nucleotidyltransferase domain-containing protein [Candidatus Woesearchaeota archaeon]|nr:nucleotidyltransferase domain-containing protein [Candidatus Woesearchaeota archaeon]